MKSIAIVEKANHLCKKVVSLFSKHILSNVEFCEYQEPMPNKIWPMPVATKCLVVDYDDVNSINVFPWMAVVNDPASQTAFEKLHNAQESKWNEDDYIPNNQEVYMGRMSIKNKIYAIWWRDDQEAYVAQEWKP